jgi:hypothetical protein
MKLMPTNDEPLRLATKLPYGDNILYAYSFFGRKTQTSGVTKSEKFSQNFIT